VRDRRDWSTLALAPLSVGYWEAKIEWHVATRSGEDLAEFLVKAEYIGREIAAGRFYKRPGKWCSWCDYLPVC